MIMKIVINLFIGFMIGFILELIYRSSESKKLIFPKFINYQMYGLTGAFLILVYYLNISLIIKLILMFIFPTLVEFLTGYLYLKIKGIYLWNYSKEPLNFNGLICLKFSLVWFIVAIAYYYTILPLIISLN